MRVSALVAEYTSYITLFLETPQAAVETVRLSRAAGAVRLVLGLLRPLPAQEEGKRRPPLSPRALGQHTRAGGREACSGWKGSHRGRLADLAMPAWSPGH